MQLIFCKSKWEMWDDPVEAFARRVRADGFAATEIYLHSVQEPPDEIVAIHTAYHLDLVAQILTEGTTVTDHLRSLDAQFEKALACRPLCINHHAGRDIFTFDENRRIFQHIIDLGQAGGIPVVIETHRGRPTYSAVDTRAYLKALPDLYLTADFSHWMVVHESDLSDQQQTLDLAMARSRHIHARVGYEEGPQVPDPRAPEWEGHVARHLQLWQRIVDHHERAGSDALTITPEFGPPNYMHTIPFTNQPVADVWEINVYMKHLLETELKVADATNGEA